MYSRAIFVALAALFFLRAQAFWRMECQGRVGLGRMDPLVAFGQPSDHSHTVHGSSGFSMTSDWKHLRAGKCSSCRVQADKSAYWTPTLHFFDNRTNEFELVEQVGGMLVYYLLYGTDLSTFMVNFSMIAGTPSRRTYTAGDMFKPDPDKSDWARLNQTSQELLSQRAVGFNCLHYKKDPEGSLYRHYMPSKEFLDANCANGMRTELMFPSCWNGDTVMPANRKDHMAYPNLVMTGECPASHPIRLPSIFFETIWNTPKYVDRTGSFVWSNGDTTGLGYHGDFVNGWDLQLLTTSIRKCTNDSGRIEDCPVFAPYLVSEDEARSCHIDTPAMLSFENVTGPVSTLPGNAQTDITGFPYANTLLYTPSPATILGSETTSKPALQESSTSSCLSTKLPTLTASTSSPNDTSLGKTAPAAMGPLAPPTDGARVASASVPVTAPTSSSVSTSSNAPEFISTQYITNGQVVSEILWVEVITYVTEINVTTDTVTVTATETANAKRKRSLHAHAHAHKKHHY